ncbi:MAG: ABC transporter permease [Promethearchaeota archaeon]
MSLEIAGMGFRNAFRRKRVALFTIISIAISVGLLYTAMSASASLQNNANTFLQDTLSPVDLVVSNGGRWGVRITPEMRTQVDTISSVSNTIPRIEEYVWIENGSESIYLFIVGLDLTLEDHVGSLDATEGTLDLSGSGCFISREAKAILNVTVGEELELYTTAGLQYLNVTGVGLAVDKGIAGPVVFISLEKALDIYHLRYPDGSVGKLLVEVDDVFSTPSVSNQVQILFGDDFVLTNLKVYPLQLATLVLTQARTILLSLVLAACFIATFRVFSAFAMVFGERKYETGVVLAFGASRTTVIGLLLAEVGTIGIVGAIAGGILGIGMGAVVLDFILLVLNITAISPTTRFLSTAYIVDVWSLLGAGLLGVGLTVLAGYVPAWRAVRESVASSLASGPIPVVRREGAISRNARRQIHILLSIVAAVLSILVVVQVASDIFSLYLISEDFLRIASIPAFLLTIVVISPKLVHTSRVMEPLLSRSAAVVRSLSSKNIRRNTLSGLVVFNLFAAVTVLFFASTNVGVAITESWKANVGGQTTSANIVMYMDPPASLDLVQVIENVDNVTMVVPMNQALGDMRSLSDTEYGLVMGIDPDGFERLASLGLIEVENRTLGLLSLNSPGTCVISEHTARTLNAHVGDNIDIGAATGVRVVGICSSSVPIFVVTLVNPIFSIVGIETWEEVKGESFVVGGMLIESTSPESSIISLATFTGAHPVLVSAVEADYQAALNSVQLIVDASLVALFIATMASAFLSSWSIASTRRREIGMLSAHGMTKTEIAKALTAESANAMILGVIVGTIGGILVEIALSEIVVRFTGGTYALFDPRIVLLVLFSLLASIGASYLAIGNTTKTRVIGLLRDLGRAS